jgi:uncharacterized membrane protein YfcA
VTELILFSLGLLVAIVGVVLGGAAFLAIPIFQVFFPGFTYGDIMGNMRVGSFARGLASTWSTRKHIHFKEVVSILIPFSLSAIVGVMAIAKLDQSYLFYAVILAIFVSELSPRIAHLITKKTRTVFSMILGLYFGFIGAGSGILIFGLLRTMYPEKKDIVHAKIQARFIELMGVIMLLVVHFYNGNLKIEAWLPWALGSLVGGYIGGYILKHFKKTKAKTQHVYLYVVYFVALLPFIIRFINP